MIDGAISRVYESYNSSEAINWRLLNDFRIWISCLGNGKTHNENKLNDTEVSVDSINIFNTAFKQNL